MNVVFTCGGTAGHINPAIAVANMWKERYPDSNILFIGGTDNMEQTLVPAAGYQIVGIKATGMLRGKSFSAIKRNFRALKTISGSVKACKKILKEFKADVVLGTGGYASFPALMAASLLKIPTCVHEANAMPGLTTRLIADRVQRVLTCFPESAKYYRHPEKVEVVGMPVRREFIYTRKDDARKELKLDERPLVVSAFGSQGARAMNEAVLEMLRLERDADYPFQHIHAVGSYGWEWMPESVRREGIDLDGKDGITVKEYLYNMPTVMAAADVIISRAGASSCNEIAASGTPCILIPSPNVTDNHQEKNARALANHGGAVLLLEKDCSGPVLMEKTKELWENPQLCRDMRKALQSMAVPDCAERICSILAELAGCH